MLPETLNHGRWVSMGFSTVCLVMAVDLHLVAAATGPAMATAPAGVLVAGVAEALTGAVLADGVAVVAGAPEVALGLCLGLAATVLQVLCLFQL
jgi:hypothetical protein